MKVSAKVAIAIVTTFVLTAFLAVIVLYETGVLPQSTSQSTSASIAYNPKLYDVQLLSHERVKIQSDACSPYPTGQFAYLIRGTIRNRTVHTINYVEIQIDWCDTYPECQEIVHTSYGYIYNLDPNEVQEFTAPENGYCDGWRAYQTTISKVY